MNQLLEFRKDKDEFFASDPDSPLTDDQKISFTGLKYFPDNPALRLTVQVDEFPEKETIQMQTTANEIQTYKRFGRFQFSMEGQTASLTIYASEDGFFLPFVDSLANTETYPAGRYLEPEFIGKGKFHIDFNRAYNPYCAYNEGWSCPITPFENRLKFLVFLSAVFVFTVGK